MKLQKQQIKLDYFKYIKNILIPIIPINRPNSNLIFGTELWNNNKKSRNNKFRFRINEKEEKETMINKLHKIKIEKGMMNTGILSNINNRIKQFKKSYLPLVFNDTNKKNKIKNIFKNEKPIRNIFRSKSCDKNIF